MSGVTTQTSLSNDNHNDIYDFGSFSIHDNGDGEFHKVDDFIIDDQNKILKPQSPLVLRIFKNLGLSQIENLNLTLAKTHFDQYKNQSTTEQIEKVLQSFVIETIRAKETENLDPQKIKKILLRKYKFFLKTFDIDVKKNSWKSYVITISNESQETWRSWIFVSPDAEPQILQEYISPTKAKLTYINSLGKIHNREINFNDQFNDLFEKTKSYLELMILAQNLGRGWDLKHINTAEPQPLERILQDITDNDSIYTKYNGDYITNNLHAGASLEDIAYSQEGLNGEINLNQKIEFTRIDDQQQNEGTTYQTTFGELLDLHKKSLVMRSGHGGDLPRSYPVEEPHDCYALLKAALVMVPLDKWSESWSTYSGDQLTWDKVMQAFIIGFKEWAPTNYEPDSPTQHSHLHLPEMILAYYDKLGNKTKEDYNQIKETFLQRELQVDFSDYPNDLRAFSFTCHYMESLGFLLSHDQITWTDAEMNQVKDWIRKAILHYFLNPQASLVTEGAHMFLGLKLAEDKFMNENK